MGSERIAVSIDGGVAHVELAREGKFNAMDREMFAAIGDTFRSLGADPAGGRSCSRGRQHFTSGLDLICASRFPPSDDPGHRGRGAPPAYSLAQNSFSALERRGAVVGRSTAAHRRRGRTSQRLDCSSLGRRLFRSPRSPSRSPPIWHPPAPRPLIPHGVPARVLVPPKHGRRRGARSASSTASRHREKRRRRPGPPDHRRDRLCRRRRPSSASTQPRRTVEGASARPLWNAAPWSSPI